MRCALRIRVYLRSSVVNSLIDTPVTTPSLEDLLHVAIDAAYLAGRRSLAYFNTPIAVDIKSDDTPVTRADREAERTIRESITRYFPTHAILGEEEGSTPGDADYRWIIDPIDGTKTFIRGVPFYGTLIGVEVKGQPSVGVCYLPALDEMVHAATGLGCHWNGRSAQVSTINKLSDAALLVTDVGTAQKRSNAYNRLAQATRFQRTWGDCYGYVLVATGRAEAMLDPLMNPWDAAPFLPILTEAGGHFTTWKGEATIYGKDAVATNAVLHTDVLSILQSETPAR